MSNLGLIITTALTTLLSLLFWVKDEATAVLKQLGRWTVDE